MHHLAVSAAEPDCKGRSARLRGARGLLDPAPAVLRGLWREAEVCQGAGSGAFFIANFWTARAALLFSTFIKRLIINKQKKTQRQLVTYHI